MVFWWGRRDDERRLDDVQVRNQRYDNERYLARQRSNVAEEFMIGTDEVDSNVERR